MQQFRLGKAEVFRCQQALDPSHQVQVFTLYCFRIVFADFMFVVFQLPLIRTPIIHVIPGNAERIKQFF